MAGLPGELHARLAVVHGRRSGSALQRASGAARRPSSKGVAADARSRSAAFRSQDLTPFDVLSLARSYARHLRNCTDPILVVGLHTAGSYFTPILSAYLRSQGHRQVVSLTIRPEKGIGPSDDKTLAYWATKGAVAAIVDGPADSGSSIRTAVDVLNIAGFSRDKISVLTPTHPTKRDWNDGMTRMSSPPFAW